MPELGAPAELRKQLKEKKIDRAGYLEAYKSHLESQQTSVERLQRLAAIRTCCLLGFRRDHRTCHRSVLADYIYATNASITEVVHLDVEKNLEPHQTVPVKIGDMEADIDKDIASLIEEIWRANMFTTNSCQESRHGLVWIEFVSALDAEAFLNIVSGSYSRDNDSLYNRVTGIWLSTVKSRWVYGVSPTDVSGPLFDDDGGVEEGPTGPPDVSFDISVRFPRSDLPLVLRRMRRHNKPKARRETRRASMPSK
jgi:hypothetical protein